MKTNSILAQFVSARPLPSYGKGAVITVTAKAYSIGDQSPYFSVTAQVTTPASRRRNDCEACGCLHEEILRLWPSLAPLVALHLSDAITGAPMHAEANGWYWLAGALGGAGEQYHGGGDKTPDECLSILADHLRISMEAATTLRDCVRHSVETPETHGQPKARFAEFVEAQRERWEQEAKDGLALIQSLSEQGAPVAA